MKNKCFGLLFLLCQPVILAIWASTMPKEKERRENPFA